MRCDGFTTNGHWMVESTLEPKATAILRENEAKPPILKLIKNHEKNCIEKNEIYLNNNFRLDTVNNIMLVELKNNSHSTWVNAFFVSLFNIDIPVIFYQKTSLEVILVKSGEKIIGCIMPIRYEE